MKQSLSLILLGAAVAFAQDSGLAALPQCGQTCVTNMLAIATNPMSSGGFGCDPSNLAQCACCSSEFAAGLADCTSGTCGQGSDQQQAVVSYGMSYCSSATAESACPTGSGGALSSAAQAVGAGMTSASSMMTSMMGGGGPLAAAAAAVETGSASNVYVVNGNTISAGGDSTDEDDVTYTALPSGAGVAIVSGDMSTTVMPGMMSGSMASSMMSSMMSGMSSTGMMEASSTSGSGGSGGSGGSSGGSETSSAQAAPLQTAAPALVGAVAIAILAL